MADILNSAVVPDASLGNDPSTQVSTPDQYGNVVITELPWGIGHQDLMYGQDPSAVNTDAVNTSTADVLRPTTSPDGGAAIDYGQTPYVPPADPVITTGSIDWSNLGTAFQGFAQGIAGVATVFAPLMSGHADLAGAGGGVGRTPGVFTPGNPAPGRRAGAPSAGAGSQSQLRLPGGVTVNTGTLLLVGLVAVVGLAVLRGHR